MTFTTAPIKKPVRTHTAISRKAKDGVEILADRLGVSQQEVFNTLCEQALPKALATTRRKKK